MSKYFKKLYLFSIVISLFYTISANAELMDPTQPTLPSESNFSSLTNNSNPDTNPNDLQLNAVLYSQFKPTAIINGSVLNINDSINGYKLINISPRSVVLSSILKGTKVVLKLDTLEVKTPHMDKSGNIP